MLERYPRLWPAVLFSLCAHLLVAGIGQLALVKDRLIHPSIRGSIAASSADFNKRKSLSSSPMTWVEAPRPEHEVTYTKPTQIAAAIPKLRDDTQLAKSSSALGLEKVPDQIVTEASQPDIAPPQLKKSILVFESADYALLNENRSRGDDEYYFFAEEVDIRIQALDNIDPQYPPEALARGQEGRVVVDILIDEKSQITKREVVFGSAPFSEAALQTLEPVRFIAPTRQQKSVKGRIMIEFLYKLAHSGESGP
jgi:TonB family protein